MEYTHGHLKMTVIAIFFISFIILCKIIWRLQKDGREMKIDCEFSTIMEGNKVDILI